MAETDLTTVDLNVPTRVILKDGMNVTMYKGEFLPNFWPRVTDVCALPVADIGWKEWFEGFKEFEAREDDVIVSSYPKSGHHWMNEIVYMLQNGTTQSANRSKELNFVEVNTMEELEKIPYPRLLLTHLSYDHMPQDIFRKKCKMFYVYRNPKDVFVSYFYHVKALESFYGFTGGWNEHFDLMLKGHHEYGRWLDSVPGWLEKATGNPKIMVLSFEDLKKYYLIRISSSRQRRLLYNEEFYDELKKACSIEEMKKNDSLDVTKVRTGTPIIRKGRVGNWKTYFTVSQNERFDAMYDPVIEKYSDLINVQYE